MSSDCSAREAGKEFMPKFDDRGLLTVVVVDNDSRDVLMVAFMNQEAIDLTIATGFCHFWSRSREKLWKKGESSGNMIAVRSMLVDCDQDALVIMGQPMGPVCHTGANSCFYRLLEGGKLTRVES